MASISELRNKIAQKYGVTQEEQKPRTELNPFLKKDGSLVNPYINYQQLLDNQKVSDKVKSFISKATGLAPKVVEAIPATTVKSTAPKAPEAPSTGNKIVSAAQKYIGTPYVWGGESANEGGMDCSGFVYSALRDAGYNVGRETAQGYRKFGNTVSKADMLPGDLIFYGKNNNNASHIGIYIGNGQMIHSSGGSKNTRDNPGKGVSIANVDYRSDFIEARRY